MATIIHPPDQGLEQTQERAAQRAALTIKFTRIMAWGAGILAVLVLTAWLFSPDLVHLGGMAFSLAVAAGGAGAYPTFHRRGQSRNGLYVFLGALAVMYLGIFWLCPEMSSAAMLGYVLLAVLGYLLFDPQTGRWVAVVSLILIVLSYLRLWMGLAEVKTPLPGGLSFGLNVALTVGTAAAAILVIARSTEAQEGYLEHYRQDAHTRLQTLVKQYVEYINEVARGNLAAQVHVAGNGYDPDDPLLVLAQNLDRMTNSLRTMIVQIKDAVNNLSSATAEILAATAQQAAGASEQSAAISETTTTVDELRTIAEQSSRRSQEVSSAAHRNVEISQSGKKAVQDTIESMGQIKERVEGIAENILALSEQTQQIGEIIATVNDIASQSNILALNASVEAARAGEHGKGFAVVAVEVRNLAEQSKQATAQVKGILSEIQKATNATVMATEEGTKRVDEGVKLAAQARQSIDQLSSVITESAQAAVQVVAGGRQQVSGIEQIALAMQNIDQATVQSLVSTRQMERAAQNLSQLAHNLAELVAQYEL